jgi:hypothetical protein
MDVCTSYQIFVQYLATSGFTDQFQILVLGHIFSGCICSSSVDKLLFALMLSQWVAFWMRHLSVGLEQVCSHLTVVLLDPTSGSVEKQGKTLLNEDGSPEEQGVSY